MKHEVLIKAMQNLQFAVENLQEVNKGATALERIVLIPLIDTVSEAHQKTKELFYAKGGVENKTSIVDLGLRIPRGRLPGCGGSSTCGC